MVIFVTMQVVMLMEVVVAMSQRSMQLINAAISLVIIVMVQRMIHQGQQQHYR
jgi:hypothetical protein